MSTPLNITSLRERLREYDPSIVKCKGQVEEVREDVLLYHPCCRPEGHEGECRNARRVLGFPGYNTLLSLLDEVAQLRAEVELAGARLAALLDAERENTVLRGELLEQARLVGMGSEREARLMAQLEEARKELQRVTESVMGALPATTVAFTGDYGMYVRACIEHLLLQELLKQDRK